MRTLFRSDLMHLLELRELEFTILVVVEFLERLLEVALDLLLVKLLDEVSELVLAYIPVLVFVEDVEDELEHLGRLKHAERADSLHELTELDLLGILRVDEIEDGVPEHASSYVYNLFEEIVDRDDADAAARGVMKSLREVGLCGCTRRIARYERGKSRAARARGALFIVSLEGVPEHVYVALAELEELLTSHDSLIARDGRRVAHSCRASACTRRSGTAKMVRTLEPSQAALP